MIQIFLHSFRRYTVIALLISMIAGVFINVAEASAFDVHLGAQSMDQVVFGECQSSQDSNQAQASHDCCVIHCCAAHVAVLGGMVLPVTHKNPLPFLSYDLILSSSEIYGIFRPPQNLV